MLTKAQAKYIQNLGHKKLRESENMFVAEGPKLVLELLNESNVQLHSIYALESFAATHPGISNVTVVKEAELEHISFLSTPNQVVALFTKPLFKHSGNYRNRISLMLDTIQDPGNMGSIVRIADWFGIATIICSRESADVFNPKVVQSTMGSIARVNVTYEDLPGFCSSHALPPVYATTLEGEPLFGLQPLKEGIILIGNESKGISNELLKLSHYAITIPKKGKAESLNAAVATGIVLSHLAK